MTQVGIIDYGVGNLRSVEKAFAATGCNAVVSSDEHVLRQAERLVLPGVGAFGACSLACDFCPGGCGGLRATWWCRRLVGIK
jgi:glutamine amidotransferase